jgi:cell division protein FtsB
MLDFRERNQLRRTLYAKPTILILGILTVLIARGAWGMYTKSTEAKAKRDKATTELQELQKYEAQLNQDISTLSTERGQEGEIRDRYMVAREGEKVIVVTDPDKKKFIP